ncbi:MAG TPA: PadR family transcriptional regulator [Anaerolineae bacterium]|nr:PadR family transcriptional regulator [Anaerolineae bacterium]
MSLEYAILGFLNYHPFSGYDLKKAFDVSIRHFWPADQSQIYRTLGRLTEQGWAEVEVIEQTERPDRKVYSITSAGRKALRSWLSSSIPHQEARSAALIQVFFAGQLSDEDILVKFEEATQGLRAILERYEQVPHEIEDYVIEIGSPREEFFWMLTLELGIRSMQTQIDWMESVMQRIRNKEHPSK